VHQRQNTVDDDDDDDDDDVSQDARALVAQVSKQDGEKWSHAALQLRTNLIANGFGEAAYRPPLLGPQSSEDKGKKTLVLDLDETLVHSAFKPVPCYAFQIDVEIEGYLHEIFVCKRPGVEEFLKKVSELYEVVVFTASLEKYANPVIDILDPQGLCAWRLFRESCTQVLIQGTMNYVKDLSRLGRDIRHVIIVDNSPIAYSLQVENAIPIKSWFDNQEDIELFELVKILKELAKVDDVPQVIRDAVPYPNGSESSTEASSLIVTNGHSPSQPVCQQQQLSSNGPPPHSS